MPFNFEEDLRLENERVLLTPLKLEHFEYLLPVASEDKYLTQYSPFSVFQPEELKQFIQKSVTELQNQVRYAFVIFDKQTQEYAGSTSFGNISNHDKRLEIGWTWIGNKFQKTGLNVNCKFLLLQYIFETLHFERLELRTDERNVKSRTAIEKIGGTLEGILRSHMLMLNGFRRSTVYYSILQNEWPEIKPKLEERLAKSYFSEV